MRLRVSRKVFGGSITSSGRSWYGSLMSDMRCQLPPCRDCNLNCSVVIRNLVVESDLQRRRFYTFFVEEEEAKRAKSSKKGKITLFALFATFCPFCFLFSRYALRRQGS